MADSVRIEQLSKSFGFRSALQAVDLRVSAGEFVALFGPNGAGKTTLLKCIAGLSRPSQGKLEVFGGDPRRDPRIRRRIGLVSHAGFLHEPLTGRENLRMYASLYDVEKPGPRIAAVLESVGMTARADEPVRNYSRGMRQRLAIARATLHDPDLLLLDEPFTGLDRAACHDVARQLGAQARDGRTVLLVTHEFDETLPMATRAVVLVSGRVARDRELTESEDRSTFVDEYLALAGGAP